MILCTLHGACIMMDVWIFDHLNYCLLRLEIDKQALAAPVKNAVDKFQLVPEFLKVLIFLFFFLLVLDTFCFWF